MFTYDNTPGMGAEDQAAAPAGQQQNQQQQQQQDGNQEQPQRSGDEILARAASVHDAATIENTTREIMSEDSPTPDAGRVLDDGTLVSAEDFRAGSKLVAEALVSAGLTTADYREVKNALAMQRDADPVVQKREALDALQRKFGAELPERLREVRALLNANQTLRNLVVNSGAFNNAVALEKLAAAARTLRAAGKLKVPKED